MSEDNSVSKTFVLHQSFLFPEINLHVHHETVKFHFDKKANKNKFAIQILCMRIFVDLRQKYHVYCQGIWKILGLFRLPHITTIFNVNCHVDLSGKNFLM
jgi:hypothetical protein